MKLIYGWLEEIFYDVSLLHPLKVKAIAEAKIKTDKISIDILADPQPADLLPKTYASSKKMRDIKNILRQRMFFVRMHSMVKNRIHDILDRHYEVVFKATSVSGLFGIAGMQWLSQAPLTGEESRRLTSELELYKFLKEKVSKSNSKAKELANRDPRARLLQSITGIGPFFSGLFYTRLVILAD